MSVEALEARTLCDVAPLAWPLAVGQAPQADGSVQLQIIAIHPRNAITLTQTPDGVLIGNAGRWSDAVAGSFASVLIRAGSGQDVVTVDASVTTGCIIYGGRNDTLTGGSGDDQIYAAPGRSVVNGGAGNDTIVTVAGRGSVVYGGDGFDNLWVAGTDRLMDVTPDETNIGAVHRIWSFMPVRPLGSRRAIKVPMTLSGQRLPEPAAANAAGYAPTRGYPLFGPDGPSPGDIEQGDSLGDCYFLAALSSIANADPGAVAQSIAGLGDGTYVVEFFHNGVPVYVREDGYLPVDATNTVVYGNLGRNNSTWVALMEKAYAYYRAGTADYAAIDGGLPAEVYDALDFAYTDSTPATQGEFVQTMLAVQQAGRAAVFGTTEAPTDSWLVPGHAYMFNGVISVNGMPEYVELRNPWGTDIFGDPTYDGYIDVPLSAAFASMGDYCSALV
jgi:hypothetical protein